MDNEIQVKRKNDRKGKKIRTNFLPEQKIRGNLEGKVCRNRGEKHKRSKYLKPYKPKLAWQRKE